MAGFDFPEFNFRLRRALNPFEQGITPNTTGGQSKFSNPWDAAGATFDLNSLDGPDEDAGQGRYNPFNFDKFYDKPGPSMEAYQAHLGKVPSPQEYAPSKWRRFGAILSGTSAALGGKDGYQTARSIVRDPYETAYEDWARSGAGLRESATLENTATKDRANYFQKVLSDMMDAQDKLEGRRIGWAGVGVRQDANEIAMYRAKVDEAYRNGQLDLGQRNLLLRQVMNENDNATTRRGQDMSKDTAEQRMFHDSIVAAQDRQNRLNVAGVYRGDTGINASEDQKIKDNAIFALSQKFGQKEVAKYFDLDTGLVINPAMPPEMMTAFEQARSQGRLLTNPRFGR